MHVIALFLFSILPAAFIALPVAAKIIAVAGFVYTLIQVLKQAPVLAPYLQGWIAIVINIVFSIVGIVMAVPSDQLYSSTTFFAVLTAALAAAGVHGTTSKLAARGAVVPAPQVVNGANVGTRAVYTPEPAKAQPKGALARFFIK